MSDYIVVQPNTFSLQQVADQLGVSLSTLYQRRNSGRIPQPRAMVGSRLRYTEDQLDQIKLYWAENEISKKESK